MSKAVFLDRDGVINRKAPEGEYVIRWQDMHFLSGVAQGIALLNQAGFLVVLVSNQRCVAKGLISAHDLELLHRRMQSELAAAGGIINSMYYCPHELEPRCECRKPAPGMLLAAARDHAIDLAASWMVGDSDHDVEAGRTAGCKTVLLKTSDVEASGWTRGEDLIAPSLLDAACQILRRETASGARQLTDAFPVQISR